MLVGHSAPLRTGVVAKAACVLFCLFFRYLCMFFFCRWLGHVARSGFLVRSSETKRERRRPPGKGGISFESVAWYCMLIFVLVRIFVFVFSLFVVAFIMGFVNACV